MRRCGNNMLSKWKIALISALVILAALLLLFLLRSNAPEPAKAPEIPAEAPLPAGVTFIDRFATLDAARWHVSDRSRDGWHVESELRPTQVATGPEGLRLTMDTNADGAGARYRSGEVQSIESFRYGYFEARMRVPRGAGVITGFFTYVGADGGDRPQEIDIEILGRSTREMALTYHVGGRGVEKIVRLPFDAAEGFHSYAFEWTADAIRWYVDNELVHEVRGARVERMSRSQKLIVNLWGTEALYRWAGRIDPVEAPWRLEVACMAQAERYMGRMLC